MVKDCLEFSFFKRGRFLLVAMPPVPPDELRGGSLSVASFCLFLFFTTFLLAAPLKELALELLFIAISEGASS